MSFAPMPDGLPLTCRSRHGWRTRRDAGGYVRATCRRCENLNPAVPTRPRMEPGRARPLYLLAAALFVLAAGQIAFALATLAVGR